MRRPRLTASTITDPELEVLLDGFDLLEMIHRKNEPDGLCLQCLSVSPCHTAELIQNIRLQMDESRQRSVPQETPCPNESSDDPS